MDIYKQAAAAKHLYCGYPWKTWYHLTVFGKKIRPNYSRGPLFLGEQEFFVYIDRRDVEEISDYYLKRQKKNNNFIFELKKIWNERCVKDVASIMKKISKENLSRLGNGELYKIFKDFSQKYDRLWSEAIFLDSFDVMSDIVLERAIAKEDKIITPNQLDLLIHPIRLSWMQKEKLSLMQISKKILRNKNLKKAILSRDILYIKKFFPQFYNQLKNHAEYFHWIYNDYAHMRKLTPEKFLKDIILYIKNPMKIRDEEKISRDIQNIKAKKIQLARKLKLSRNFIKKVDFLVTLVGWRDDRKAYNQMANAVIFLFAKEFAARYGISVNGIESLFWWEISQNFSISRNQRKFYKKRNSAGFYTGVFGKRGCLILGGNAKNLHDFIEKIISQREFKGKTAHGGKIRGRVKIVFSQKDFYKMKKGDILVAPNTRPEYVPIMKIAGAIITEEGGMTCHAAIVSRELKIPCIVGMQGALGKLKDGEMVEVDAGRGIIKKINK